MCGTRGEGPLERVVLGCTASSLLHHADRPLLLAPAGAVASDGPVVAGYDDSDGARGALRFAAEHLGQRPVVVAHAWRSPVRHTIRGHALEHSGIDSFADYADAVDRIYEDAAEEMAGEGAEYARSLGLVARAAAPESGHGEWQTLLAGAQEAGAAAILVGSRGRGAVTSTVLGSVASGLVHAAALPVSLCPSRCVASDRHERSDQLVRRWLGLQRRTSADACSRPPDVVLRPLRWVPRSEYQVTRLRSGSPTSGSGNTATATRAIRPLSGRIVVEGGRRRTRSWGSTRSATA